MNITGIFQHYFLPAIPAIVTGVAAGVVTVVAKCARRVFGDDRAYLPPSGKMCVPTPFSSGVSYQASGEHRDDQAIFEIVREHLQRGEDVCSENPLVQQQLRLLRDTTPSPFHTLRSPVVGSRAHELKSVQEMMRQQPVLAKFQQALYKEENTYLIPTEKKEAAEQIAKDIFLNYILKYETQGYTEHNIIGWVESCILPGVTYIYEAANEWNTWTVHPVVVVTGAEENSCYLPRYVTAYHELMHVEETPLCAKETKVSNHPPGYELLTSIKTSILLDHIYKKIYGIEESSVVDYGKFIGNIPLGAVVNFYRQQENIHGTLSRALVSPESIAFLKKIKFT